MIYFNIFLLICVIALITSADAVLFLIRARPHLVPAAGLSGLQPGLDRPSPSNYTIDRSVQVRRSILSFLLFG